MAAFAQRFFGSLQYQDFRRLWTANASAQAAAWALIITRGWLIFDKTDSSFWVGAGTFAAMAPQFFVPPFIGVLADRVDRRTILVWTYSINTAQCLLLFGLAAAGLLPVWALVLLSLVNGAARAAQLPASQAMAANLVPRESLLNALSLNASTFHGARLIGPGIVTPLVSVAGVASGFLLCTLLYASGLLQVLSIAKREPVAPSGESFLSNFLGGLSYVYMRPVLRFIIVLALMHCGLTMAFESLLPEFAHDQLGQASSGGFATLMLGVGMGAFIASVLISGIETQKARGNALVTMALLSGVGQVLLSLTGTLWLALLAAALMGGAQAAFMTMAQAVTQSIASDAFRGRVASINSFSLGGAMAVMNLLNGSLANYIGITNLLFWQGLAFIFLVLLTLLIATGRRVYGPEPLREAQTAAGSA